MNFPVQYGEDHLIGIVRYRIGIGIMIGIDGLGPIGFSKVMWARRASQAQPGRWSLPPTVAWLAGLRVCGLAVLLRSSPGRRPDPRPPASSPRIRGHIIDNIRSQIPPRPMAL